MNIVLVILPLAAGCRAMDSKAIEATFACAKDEVIPTNNEKTADM
jgi:hypothetical protein